MSARFRIVVGVQVVADSDVEIGEVDGHRLVADGLLHLVTGVAVRVDHDRDRHVDAAGPVPVLRVSTGPITSSSLLYFHHLTQYTAEIHLDDPNVMADMCPFAAAAERTIER